MTTTRQITIADEVWIATALLHRENPTSSDFSVQEIYQRLTQERLAPTVRAGVMPHIYQHCVANYRANPARLRMLLATSKDHRRLWRPGDACHPDRYGGRQIPSAEDIPSRCHTLLSWYRTEFVPQGQAQEKPIDPILALLGLGKELWAGEDPDEYVRRLREGWE